MHLNHNPESETVWSLRKHMDQDSVLTRCDNSEATAVSWLGKVHFFWVSLLKSRQIEEEMKKKETLEKWKALSKIFSSSHLLM